MTNTYDNRSTECSNPSCPCHEWSARMPSESPALPERDAVFPVSEAKNVFSGDSEPNNPIPAPSGHILYTVSNCQIFHDLQGNRQCPVCEGGLAICRLCNEYEAGLDKPCARAITSARANEAGGREVEMSVKVTEMSDEESVEDVAMSLADEICEGACDSRQTRIRKLLIEFAEEIKRQVIEP